MYEEKTLDMISTIKTGNKDMDTQLKVMGIILNLGTWLVAAEELTC